MHNNTFYQFPLTLTEEMFNSRNELTHCLAHILTQVALKGIDLTTFSFDDEPFDFDYIAMVALTDIFESDSDVIVYIEQDSNFWEVNFPDIDKPEDINEYTIWETDYLGHHFTFWLN